MPGRFAISHWATLLPRKIVKIVAILARARSLMLTVVALLLLTVVDMGEEAPVAPVLSAFDKAVRFINAVDDKHTCDKMDRDYFCQLMTEHRAQANNKHDNGEMNLVELRRVEKLINECLGESDEQCVFVTRRTKFF